jgi:hypothetical protein
MMLHRPVDTAHYKQPAGIEPRLRRVLDKLSPAPAFIKTATWDVVAWNKAATLIWPAIERRTGFPQNTLRMVFLDPKAKTLYYDWESVARMAVAGFRADVARAGAIAEVAVVVDELSRLSPAFKSMWKKNDVSDLAQAVKDLRHPVLGTLSFEASIFGVDGRQDLTMMFFLPLSADDAERITDLIQE